MFLLLPYAGALSIVRPNMNTVFLVNETDLVSLECTAIGTSMIEISWNKNGQEHFISDSRVTVSTFNTTNSSSTDIMITSILNLSSTRDEDSGLYSCQASDEYGNLTREIELIVQGMS